MIKSKKPPLLGLDGAFNLTDQFKLELAYDNYLRGNFKDPKTYSIKTLQTSKVKLTYMLNDNWGASASYRSIIEHANTINKFTFFGGNVGISYSF